MSLHPNTKITKHLLFIHIVAICILAASFARANPYLAKPGEAPVTVYVATCAVSGGFIQLYTALDQNLFEKYASRSSMSSSAAAGISTWPPSAWK